MVKLALVGILGSLLFPVTFMPNAAASAQGLLAHWINQPAVTTPNIDPYSFVSNTCHTATLQRINQSSNSVSPGGTCTTTNFSTYITGFIKAPHSGRVDFYSRNDDGFKLVINGQVVINDWTAHAMAAEGQSNGTGFITLVADEVYPIQIYHHQGTGGWGYILDWSYGSTARNTIAATWFGTTSEYLKSTPTEASICQIGFSAECPALSPQEIYSLYGTVTNDTYWLRVNGAPIQAYIIFDRSLGDGSWILAAQGNKSTTAFKYNDRLWTTNSVLNSSSVPSLIGSAGTGTDAKYEVFNSLVATEMMAIFPEVPKNRGGAFAGNDYGFILRETVSTAGSLNFSGESGCPDTKTTLLNLFSSSNRCGFRLVLATYDANETPYSTIGNGVFSSQKDIRFYGINYIQTGSVGTPSVKKYARWGFGWNENGATNEDSNDMINGIGLRGTSSDTSTDIPTGDHVGCCATATGLAGSGPNATRQLAFNIFVKTDDPSLGSPSNLVAVRDTSGTTNLSWTKPNSVDPQEYVVQYKTRASSWSSSSTFRVITPSSTPSASLQGLSNDVNYDYRVFARTYTYPNTFNFSVLPATTSTTKLATPNAPTVSSSSTSSITVQYDTVAAASSYTVRVYDSSNELIGSERDNFVSGATIEGLLPSTSYWVTVQARGDAVDFLDSDISESSTVVTLARALMPSILTQPADTVTTVGLLASFAVTVSSPDDGFITYRWFESSTTNSAFLLIPNEVSSVLEFPAELSDSGSRFQVEISNTRNSDTAVVLSTIATLIVNPTLVISGGSAITTTFGVGATSQAFVAAGGTGTRRFFLTPFLDGVTMDSVTGVVTVDASAARGSYSRTVSVRDEAGATASTEISIAVSTGISSVVLSISGPRAKGESLVITATTTSLGTVRFVAKNRVIRGCATRNVVSGTLRATCLWKASVHGPIAIFARYTSSDSNWGNAETRVPIVVQRRTSR